MLDGHIMDIFQPENGSCFYTNRDLGQYLEAPSEQRRDALILRHVQPFQFSALRALDISKQNPSLTWI